MLPQPSGSRPVGQLPTTIPRGTMIRLYACAGLCAVLLYLVLFWNPGPAIEPATLPPPEQPLVSVPTLDRALLGKAKDSTREERLFLEAEPLSHLLAQALNVSPEAARALGMPEHMPPVEALRTNTEVWRGRWIWFRGVVESIDGPRPGHPIPGYSVFEALLRLEDGQRVLFAFTKPPAAGVEVGATARAEGYVLKLRDLAMPEDLRNVPMLVGAELERDYRQWDAVQAIDDSLLAAERPDLVSEGGKLVPSPESWLPIDAVQGENRALWHLAAYARDGAPKTLEEWRRVPALSSDEIWDGFKKDEVHRGTPMRILGMLAAVRTIQASPNPAGVEEWTEAWLQVRDLHGKTIPVWVAGRTDQPLGTSLEVRGFYLRRYCYRTRDGSERWTPLFVAARLDPFVFDGGHRMAEAAAWTLGAAFVLMIMVVIGVRRENKRSRAQEDALVQRRRNRRQKRAGSAEPDVPLPEPQP